MPLIGTRKYPKGPNLKRLETHTFNLSGTKVTFRAPAHNHDSIPATPPLREVFNLYDTSLFGRFEKTDVNEPAAFALELKYWLFTGIPVLDGTGYLGEMTFHVSILHLPQFESLFRPKGFECAIERCIYASPCAYHMSNKCRLGWQVVKLNSVTWVKYRSDNSVDSENSYETVWHTPISGEHLLTVRFSQAICKPRTRLAETYQQIIGLVMESFEIQLSRDAQAQKAAVEAQFPDEKLSESLPPYEFETVNLLERLQLINTVSEENNHDMSIPDDVFEEQVQQKDREQKQRATEVKQQILKSHLRFKAQEL